jgi:hypothetical protein
MPIQKEKEKCMSTVIRVAILGWSAALLTASYGGVLQKFDPTFIATVFTACAATFGVNTMKKDGSEDLKKNPELEISRVEPTPEPEVPAVVVPEATTENCPNCNSEEPPTDTSVPVGRV